MDRGESGGSHSRAKLHPPRLTQRWKSPCGHPYPHNAKDGTLLSGGGPTGDRHASTGDRRGSGTLSERFRHLWLLERHPRRECGDRHPFELLEPCCPGRDTRSNKTAPFPSFTGEEMTNANQAEQNMSQPMTLENILETAVAFAGAKVLLTVVE